MLSLLCDRRRALVRSAREVRVQIHTREGDRLVRRVEIASIKSKFHMIGVYWPSVTTYKVMAREPLP